MGNTEPKYAPNIKSLGKCIDINILDKAIIDAIKKIINAYLLQ